MTQQVLVTLTSAGIDTGPFLVQDNLGNLLGSNVSKSSLLSGITYNVDINATEIYISSLGECNNGIILNISGGTTTTTTTTIYNCLPAGTILASFCAPGPYCPSGLDLWYTYADGNCGSYSEPSGLCCSGSEGPIITLDKVYYGFKTGSGYPTESEILSGSYIEGIDAAQNFTLDFTPFNSVSHYIWFSIPNRTPNHSKDTWYEDYDNNGNIGSYSDLFGPYTSSLVSSNNYITSVSNYATQVYGLYLFAKT